MALRPKLNRVWTSANSVLRRDPGDAKYIQGWVSEIPTFQVLNYLQYKVDTTLLAQAERGIFEWGSDITYVLGSIVWCENDKKIYVSTVGSPDKTKAPNTNLAHWSPSSIQVPRASYDAILASINSHIANKSNPHNLSAAQLGSYTKAETDALVAQYQALVLAHSSNKNNPHGVTALQVGAVPATGGTYTGDVTFNGGMFFDAGKVNQISKTGGLYLQAGTAVMGIDATGAAVVGTTSSKSKIVSEATFPALKALQEPSYATPDPVFSMDLLGSINIRRGVGTVGTQGFSTPQYDAALGNAISLYNPTTAEPIRTIQTQEDRVFDVSANSIAYDVLSKTPRNAEPGFSLLVGMSNATGSQHQSVVSLSIDNGGIVTAARFDGALVVSDFVSWQLPKAVGVWYRLAATFDGPRITLYCNGVAVARTDIATQTQALKFGRVQIATNPKPAEFVRNWTIKNFRIWDSALTDKQVSTL